MCVRSLQIVYGVTVDLAGVGCEKMIASDDLILVQSEGRMEHPTYNKTKEGCNRIGHILLRNCLLKQVGKNKRDVKTRKKT